MTHVDSSAVSEVEYDAERAELLIRFVGGAAYAYADVPPAVFDAFLEADSKGRFFTAEVRDRYPFRRL